MQSLNMEKQNVIPADIILKLPENSQLPQSEQHFLLYIPWETKYMDFIPLTYKSFFDEILPLLKARTTDVHTAVCMQYLDELIDLAHNEGKVVNRNILAYSLMLHDSGWSQMSESEIAQSLGVKGLALNETAMRPKEKHAVLSEQIARDILTRKQDELGLSTTEIELICKAILYHDKPEEVAGAGEEMSIEVQLLVDLDHIWSFTRLNFWQDILRKGVDPNEYLENLKNDLDSYFVTHIGKQKARELLSQREKELKNDT